MDTHLRRGLRNAVATLARRWILALCAAGNLAAMSAVAADAISVDAAGLPVVVRQVLAAKYPGWTLERANQVEVDGQTRYELHLTDQTIEIVSVLDAGGHIIEAVRGVGVAAAAPAKLADAPDQSHDRGAQSPKKGKQGKEKKFGKPKVYGFAQVFYREAMATGSDGVVDNSNFRVQRVRLGVKGDISSWLSYQIEIDPRAPEVTGILRDAYLRLRLAFIPDQQIRIGQQKTQFGYENRASSTELFAVNRAEISDNLARGINLRDLGVGLIGHLGLNDAWRLEDAITVVNGAGLNVQNDDTGTKNVWGRLGLRHKDGSSWERFGISGGTGDFIDVGDPLDPADDVLIKFDRIGFDVEFERKWLFFSAEYIYGLNDTSGVGTPADPSEPPLRERAKLDGYYFNLVGKTPWHIGPIVRYDVFGDAFARWTFGAYYGDAKDQFRVMVNYEYRQKFEDANGHVGRGDDKLYLWTQVRF